MQRAAMTASALAKERRELKEQQQRTLLEAIPKDLSRCARTGLGPGLMLNYDDAESIPRLGSYALKLC